VDLINLFIFGIISALRAIGNIGQYHNNQRWIWVGI